MLWLSTCNESAGSTGCVAVWALVVLAMAASFSERPDEA